MHAITKSPNAIQHATDDERTAALWLERTRSANTRRLYARIWRDYAAQGGRIAGATYHDLHAWQAALAGSANTIAAYTAALRSLFAFATDLGYLRANPALLLQAPQPTPATHERILSESDVHALLLHSHGRDRALLHVLYSSGARCEEVLGLRWVDVQPAADGRAVLVLTGKRRKVRQVGISAAAYAALLTQRREGAQPTDYIFQSANGRKLDHSNAWRLFKAAAQRAGLHDAAHASPHWLRHSHISHALQRGAGVVDVQSQVGHASLATTTRYAHASRYSSDSLSL